MNDGWYQIRIAGLDVDETSLSARLHEPLPDGAIIHIVPRMAGAKSGGLFQVVLGAVAIGASFFTAGEASLCGDPRYLPVLFRHPRSCFLWGQR